MIGQFTRYVATTFIAAVTFVALVTNGAQAGWTRYYRDDSESSEATSSSPPDWPDYADDYGSPPRRSRDAWVVVPAPAPIHGAVPGHTAPRATAPGAGVAEEPVPPGTTLSAVARVDPALTRDPLHDTTLRRGDAVMTRTGPVVFIGDPDGSPHTPTDFVPPSRLTDLTASQRNWLASLDPKRDAKAAGDARAGRSVADSSPVVTGRTIVDPRGRTIRYIGP